MYMAELVCSFCGSDLDDKKSVRLSSGDLVCNTACDKLCSQCKELTKFSINCFACKRNIAITNRMV